MNSIYSIPKNNYFLPIMICVFYFVTAKFFFFNLLGIKRELLYFIIWLTLIISIIKIDYLLYVFKQKNIILLNLYCIIVVWLIHNNIDTAIIYFTVTVMIGFILNFSQKRFDFTSKLLITCACIFSIFAIIQAIIYIYHPEVFDIPYSPVPPGRHSLEPIAVKYPIHYLGFWAAGREEILGIELPRFESFASEPSILVAIILIPGLLGLTYNGIIRKMSYVILFFSTILAFAGTIYLSLALGFVVFFSLFLFRFIMNNKFKPLSIAFVFMVFYLCGYFMIKTDVYAVMNLMDIGLSPYSDYSSILGHASKPYARVVSSQQAAQLVSANPFGTQESVLSVTGLLLDYGMLFGYLGVILCGIIYTKIIIRFISAFYIEFGLIYKIGISLIIGTIIQTLFFSSYGWLTPSGLIITSLLYVRSNNLINNFPKTLKF
jgi:hypothetical protein